MHRTCSTPFTVSSEMFTLDCQSGAQHDLRYASTSSVGSLHTHTHRGGREALTDRRRHTQPHSAQAVCKARREWGCAPRPLLRGRRRHGRLRLHAPRKPPKRRTAAACTTARTGHPHASRVPVSVELNGPFICIQPPRARPFHLLSTAAMAARSAGRGRARPAHF